MGPIANLSVGAILGRHWNPDVWAGTASGPSRPPVLLGERGLGLLLLLSFGLLAARCRAADLKVGEAFFSGTNPVHLEITVSSNDIPALNRKSRDYVPVLVSFPGQSPVRAGLRLRGFSSFQPMHKKPAFALKFTEPNAKEQFGGLSKLLVNNCASDSCCMREQVACSLFRAAGVPAARTRPVRVRINQRDIGLCLAVEAMNKDFLRRNFGDASGNLYEGTTRDIDLPLELDNGTDKSGDDLRQLLAAAREPDSARRWEKLNGILDVDRFLKFAALQVFLGHSDGYLAYRNNYRIYHDPSSSRMVFIPHGLDTTFMQGGAVLPSTNNIVMRALYSMPEGRRRYLATCHLLMSNVWQLASVIDQINGAGRAVNALAQGPVDSQRSSNCVDFLIGQVMGRRHEMLAWLSEPEPKLLSLARGEMVLLTNWNSFLRFGTASLAIVTNLDGTFLRIDAPAPTAAGWRCRAIVSEGEYLFSCRVLAKPLPNSSSGEIPALLFRLNGELTGAALARTGEWQKLNYRFLAPPEGRMVEFLCELQTGKGDIWIDLSSLKMTRNR